MGLCFAHKSLFCLLAVGLFQSALAASPPKSMAYYFIKSVNDGIRPKDVPCHQLTHAIYAFVDISPDGKCSLINDSKSYTDLDQNLIRGFSDLKKTCPNLKTMFSIGGAKHSKGFSYVSATPESRKKFVESCIGLMKKYSFDGVDLDWEVPGTKTRNNPNSTPEDPDNLVKLLGEFRQQLPQDGLLSAAISSDPEEIGYLKIKGMSGYLNWFGVMNYTLCGTWSKKTCHHSDYEGVGKQGVQLLLNGGAKREQIVLGVPFFGMGWKVDSAKNCGIGEPIQELVMDEVTYKEIEEKYLSKGGYELYWDEKSKEPVLFNSAEKIAISFDNEDSLRMKAQEVLKRGFGGVMVWEVTGDSKTNSLLNAINVGLGRTRPKDKKKSKFKPTSACQK